jgi:phospholipid/cholesterol/gamma-HCH transport system substrate-binding protein
LRTEFMTADQEKRIQLRVGVFTLVGLLLIGAMVTYFGRLGEGFKRFYEVRVEYPNASGLLKGADVLMAGAKVGKVADGPFILPTGAGVYVNLKLYDFVEVPANSTFTIGSSGLLGDRFVDITMPPEEEQAPALQPGQTVQGKREAGIGELADQGGQMIEEIRTAVQTITGVIKRIDTELLTKETLTGVGESVGHLRATTENLATSSGQLEEMLTQTAQKLDTLMDEAAVTVKESQKTMAQGTKTMESAAAAAKEIQGVTADLRKVVADVQRGRGLLGLLLYDEETARNVRALIANLRDRGILFYRDRAVDPEPEPPRRSR